MSLKEELSKAFLSSPFPSLRLPRLKGLRIKQWETK
jgi:hypothetical protein